MNESNINDIVPQNCNENDMQFYLSVLINIGLLLTFGSSELMAVSGCKSNGILDLLCKVAKSNLTKSSQKNDTGNSEV